jgi:tetratricopeptide (TPR) repeat protein
LSEGILAEIKEVAGKGRMLQITAPFTEGYSGSPVFNEQGEVIGMATFIVKGTGDPTAYQKLNFAVPVDRIRESALSSSLTPMKDFRKDDYQETSDYWVGLGNRLTGSGKYSEAADAYKKALNIDPSDAEALNGLGISYMKLKKNKEAIEIYKQAIALGSNTAWVYSNLGLAYIEARMYKEALEPLTQATNIMPELEEAHYNLGIAYKNLGMPKEAIASFKNAISINPNSRDAHFGLGLTHMDVKDKDSALEEYSLLKTLDPSLAEMLLKRIRQ